MLAGEKFKLDTPTIGLAAPGGRQVLIPAGSIIEIAPVSTQSKGMVAVLWDDELLTMFALDVDMPGTESEEPQHSGLSAYA